jgi:hypothetical protein
MEGSCSVLVDLHGRIEENLSGRDLKPGLAEYEEGVIITRPRCPFEET